jgi:hypothetical protein
MAGAKALLISAFYGFPAQGQPATANNPFRLERFTEDWSAMAEDAARSRLWHRLKWIELGKASITLGGDLRLRSEFVDATRVVACRCTH